jgi:hypothetical protein
MLKLKLKKEEFEKLEDAIKGLYKLGGDGNYHLDAESDDDSKAKLQEFRDNNIKLKQEMEELMKKYKDVDPEKYKEYSKKMQELEDKKLIDAGKIDELVNQKVDRMKADFENQIKEMKKALAKKDEELQQKHSRLSEVLIDSEITKAVTEVGGVRKDAMQDIIARGKRVWRLEEGKPVPKEGDKILYGKDGKEQMTFREWADVLYETAPFLFEASGGGGAAGAGSAGTNKGKMSAEELSKLPPQERLKMIHSGTLKASGK